MEYKDQGVQVLGVDLNESFFTVTGWATNLGITYPILLDLDYDVWDLYGMGYIPHNVLIDPDMVVRYTNYGFDFFIKDTLIGLIETYRSDASALDPEPEEQLESYQLLSNYPNPFNASTIISYTVLEKSDVHLTVYDINGREIWSLNRDQQPAGTYSLTFNGDDLRSGVYFCELIAGTQRNVRKLILLK